MSLCCWYIYNVLMLLFICLVLSVWHDFLSFSDSAMRRFKLFSLKLQGEELFPSLSLIHSFCLVLDWPPSWLLPLHSCFLQVLSPLPRVYSLLFEKFQWHFDFLQTANNFVVLSMTLPIILKLLSTWYEKHDKSAKTILHIFGYLSNLCTSIHHLSILFALPLMSKAEGSLSSSL